MFHVTAPGKIILSGEHSVVYGEPAILTTVGFENRANIQSVNSNYCTFRTQNEVFHFDLSKALTKLAQSNELLAEFRQSQNPKVLTQIVESVEDFVLIAVGEFLEFYQLWNTTRRFSLSVEAGTPIGRGFGSSASLASVIAGSLSQLFFGQIKRSEIFQIVQAVESKVHGNPSGADASAVIFGGQMVFQKNSGARNFQANLDLNRLGLTLVDSGQPLETTGEMVSRVREYVNGNLSKGIEGMGNITSQVQRSLELGSAERFLELIQQNQRCLEKIGVVSESTRRFIKEIEANGGVAKVAGAGGFEQGSGVVLVFGLDRELVESIAQNFGFLGYPSVNLAGPGLVALD